MPSLLCATRRCRSLITSVPVALALLFSGIEPAAAQTETPSVGSRVGLSTHVFWLGQTDAERDLSALRAGGPEWIRDDFVWDQLEPTKGNFNWSKGDNLMAAAAKNNLTVLGVLAYSARWASSDPSGAGNVHYPPRDPADFANFARKVVERYGVNGNFWTLRPELPKRPLAAVELWNEPYGYWFWKPTPDPVAYARLAHAGAAAIKAAQPSMKVLLPGDILQLKNDGTAGPWLAPMLKADPQLASLFDAFSTHPYPDPRERGPFDTSSPIEFRFNRSQPTRDIAAAHGVNKPLWLTEFGWSTAAGVSDTVSETTQAQFLSDAVTHALVTQKVERVFVYTWNKSNEVYGDREGNYGLRHADGTYKPAWARIKTLISGGLPGETVTAPVPAPTASPTPAPTQTPAPTPTQTPAPTPAPAPAPAPAPSPSPTPTPTPSPAPACKPANSKKCRKAAQAFAARRSAARSSVSTRRRAMRRELAKQRAAHRRAAHRAARLLSAR